MRTLAALFLVGLACVAAVPLPSKHVSSVDEVENDVLYLNAEKDNANSEYERRLKERFDEILEKIHETINEGQIVKDNVLQQLKEIKELLNEMKVDISDKAKDLLKQLKNKATDLWHRILEKLHIGKDGKSLEVHGAKVIEDMSLYDRFWHLRDALNKIDDLGKLKTRIEELFGRGSESGFGDRLLDTLEEKGEEGRKELIELVKHIFESLEQQGVADLYQKIRDYFKDLNIDLKEKFLKFGEWAKQVFDKGLEKSKDRVENIKKIAKEFIENARDVSKDVAAEALEFLREYKDDLGTLYDEVKEKVKEILNRD